ncbi:SBBP repeat-containing protein, partial [Acidobacteriota bacterium]
LWLTKEGLVFDSIKRSKVKGEREKEESGDLFLHSPIRELNDVKVLYERDVSRLMFIGANKNPEMTILEPARLKVNYFKGNDRSKWHNDVPTSMAVRYKNLYKNIDLKVYGIEKMIEYDWIIKPSGNPQDIRFEYKNAKGTHIDDKGDLIIDTEFGELVHKRPVSYQKRGAHESNRRGIFHKSQWKIRVDALRQPLSIHQTHRTAAAKNFAPQREHIDVKFKKIGKNSYGFAVGDYDKNRELIIDPVVLVYSTYLGGSSDDYSYGIAVDDSGDVYVTGYTWSNDFPTRNQYMEYQDDIDVFVSRIDTTRSGAASLIYSTYLGGRPYQDYGTGIAVDGSGNAYVTGYTRSSDFPTRNPYQEYQGNYDAFITRLDTNKSGDSSLIYSSYLGGWHSDYGQDIAAGDSGNVYVTGYTYGPGFPTCNPYQGEYHGSRDAFVTGLNTNRGGVSSLLYSTYLGGEYSDSGKSIAVDNNGYIYVTGETGSADFPTRHAYQAHQTFTEVFVTKLNPNQGGDSSLIYSTYLGGESEESGYGIAVDSSGNAYVTGFTYSMDFPIRNEYQDYQGAWYVFEDYSDAFVARVDTTLSGDSSLIYSTFLGSLSSDYSCGIAVNNSGIAYVTGSTGGSDFPTRHEFQAYQGDGDAFVAGLNTGLAGDSSLIYSTYLGGGARDGGMSIAVDNNGHAYVAGNTESMDFPTRNRYQAYQGGDDTFVAKLILADVPKVTTAPAAEITSVSAIGGGKVRNDFGAEVIARGVCWSTSSRPTLSDNHTTDGSGTGTFTSQITGLIPNTTYYVRAYATNLEGTGYGRILSFKTLLNPKISGTVKSSGGTGVAMTILTFSNNGGTTMTNRDGYYNHIVSYNWTGTAIPSKPGYVFEPVNRTYEVVTSNRTGQDYTAYYMVLHLSASRESESAWIIRRYYGKINLTVDNPGNIPVAQYIIHRKELAGNYLPVREIPVSQLQDGTYLYYDKYLDKDKSYTYKFSVVDAGGVTIAISNEKTI